MTLLSPGVELKETSLQTSVVNNSTGRAAMVGKFKWGPAFQITQITGENDLKEIFGSPDDNTADYFLSAANILTEGNDLRLVRVVSRDNAKNASPLASNIQYTISNAGSNYEVGDQVRVKYMGNIIEDGGKVTSVDKDGKILTVYVPSAKVISYATSINQYPALSDSWTSDIVSKTSGVSAQISLNGISTDSGILLTQADTAKQNITDLNFLSQLSKFGLPPVTALYPGELGNDLEVEIVSKDGYAQGANLQQYVYPTGTTRASTAKSVFPYGPQTSDQYGIIVRRNGAVVESFVLSTKQGDKNIYGNNIFMDDYFANGSSNFVFASSQNWPVGFNGVIQLSGGVSANDKVTAGDLMEGWDLFADKESIYVNLLCAGAAAGETIAIASTVQKHAIAIAEERKDCLVSISPPRDIVVNVPVEKAIDNIVNWRQGTGNFTDNNMNVSSIYTTIDGNYKYQYDKYNDVNRWVPLSGDIIAACIRTDNVAYTWNSPAGYKRGQIKNCIKLAIEPRASHRDALYQVAINPVINGAGGEGFIIFGDKTATNEPSPFDRINVRRLFNMVEKAIGDSSKYRLFENNDTFTRNSFRMETSAYLSTIKSLGGVYDFKVICDKTNNTDAIIDAHQFVATFMIKPARSINFILLNFVATATGADFDELVG